MPEYLWIFHSLRFPHNVGNRYQRRICLKTPKYETLLPRSMRITQGQAAIPPPAQESQKLRLTWTGSWIMGIIFFKNESVWGLWDCWARGFKQKNPFPVWILKKKCSTIDIAHHIQSTSHMCSSCGFQQQYLRATEFINFSFQKKVGFYSSATV